MIAPIGQCYCYDLGKFAVVLLKYILREDVIKVVGQGSLVLDIELQSGQIVSW